MSGRNLKFKLIHYSDDKPQQLSGRPTCWLAPQPSLVAARGRMILHHPRRLHEHVTECRPDKPEPRLHEAFLTGCYHFTNAASNASSRRRPSVVAIKRPSARVTYPSSIAWDNTS